jgi:hypothetical protein
LREEKKKKTPDNNSPKFVLSSIFSFSFLSKRAPGFDIFFQVSFFFQVPFTPGNSSLSNTTTVAASSVQPNFPSHKTHHGWVRGGHLTHFNRAGLWNTGGSFSV